MRSNGLGFCARSRRNWHETRSLGSPGKRYGRTNAPATREGVKKLLHFVTVLQLRTRLACRGSGETSQENRMKKLILLTAFALLLPVIGFLSCNPCGSTPDYFDVNGMQVSNWVVSRTQLPDGNYKRLPQEGEVVSFANHFVNVNFEVAFAQKEAGSGPPGAAFALSCGNPVSREKIDTFFVITRNAWDAMHPVGDTINDLVETYNHFVMRYEDLAYFSPGSLYGGSAQGRPLISTSFAFRVGREPAFKDVAHAFRLVFRFRNGETYSGETGGIRFR